MSVLANSYIRINNEDFPSFSRRVEELLVEREEKKKILEKYTKVELLLEMIAFKSISEYRQAKMFVEYFTESYLEELEYLFNLNVNHIYIPAKVVRDLCGSAHMITN